MNDKKHRTIIKTSRDVNMFAELSHGTSVILENAKHKNSGYHYEIISAIILAACSFEGFINHAGFLLFPWWESVERNRWSDKLAIITSHVGYELDRGSRPFQTVDKLFWVRNQIVHGKPETLEHESPSKLHVQDIEPSRPKTEWELQCNLDFAERAHEDSCRLAFDIWNQSGLPKEKLRLSGFGYSVITE